MTPLLLAALCSTAGPTKQVEPKVVAEVQTRFGPALVIDEGDHRILRFGDPGGDDQTVIERGHPEKVPTLYVRTLAAAFAWPPVDAPVQPPADPPAERSALLVGLGGGSLIRFAAAVFPEIAWHAVEIAPEVVELAKRHFDLPKATQVHVADGVDYLKASGPKFDLIFLDAYSADSMPEGMRGAAFFRVVRARLRPGGLAVLNLAVKGAVESEAERAFAEVFAGCLRRRVPEEENLVLFGADRLPKQQAWQAAGTRAAVRRQVHWDMGEDVRVARPCRRHR